LFRCVLTSIPMDSPTQPTAHLLHGFIGSGKTTFARKIQVELPAVRFTHDEWMVSLFGHRPAADQYPENFARVESLIWELAKDVLRVKQDVILDLGFWSRASRDLARERVLAMDAIPRFYSLSCPEPVMRARTLKRSENPPLDSLWIDEPAFDKLWSGFEPMGSDEEFTRVDGNTERGQSRM